MVLLFYLSNLLYTSYNHCTTCDEGNLQKMGYLTYLASCFVATQISFSFKHTAETLLIKHRTIICIPLSHFLIIQYPILLPPDLQPLPFLQNVALLYSRTIFLLNSKGRQMPFFTNIVCLPLFWWITQ